MLFFLYHSQANEEQSTFVIRGGVNQEIVKNIASCNFLIITVMYIKVYIWGMEMSQGIRCDFKFY